MKHAGPEDILQHQICNLLDYYGFYYFHPLNEGKRSHWEIARMKYLGSKAGIPDLIIILNGGRVAWVEIKTPTGRLQESQRYFERICADHGHTYSVWRSEDDCRAWCLDNLGGK